MHGNRETSGEPDAREREGQVREGMSHNPQQYPEESDAVDVPTWKKSTKARVTPDESMEGRTAANEEVAPRNTSRAQDRHDVLTHLERLGRRAEEQKEERFGNLLSHIKVPLLREAYARLSKKAAPGVDGETWSTYGENLDARLLDLQERVQRGSYHPQPVRRVHIPKGDGRTRPLGIPSLEDKIVQQAARMLLEPIYERMFVGFSYGFRPGRSQHDALDALAVAISKRVDWVLDADIRAFFDTIDHAWMKKFIEHRIADRRMVRLLMKWLHAGVMEDGELRDVTEGTPQGGIISPLLANLYLHYVLDLWVLQWRRTQARGEMYVVRYADDFVMGFQRESDARAMRAALAERLAHFGLELHPDKTRVIRFGRFAHRDSGLDGRTRPETFDFLGFAHRGPGPARPKPPDSTYFPEEEAGEAQRAARGHPRSATRASTRATRVAFERSTRARQLLWRAFKLRRAPLVPPSGAADVARRAAEAKPASSLDRGAAKQVRRALPSASAAHHSTDPATAPVDPLTRRWEPGAGNPHAGFCPGGAPQGASLPGLVVSGHLLGLGHGHALDLRRCAAWLPNTRSSITRALEICRGPGSA